MVKLIEVTKKERAILDKMLGFTEENWYQFKCHFNETETNDDLDEDFEEFKDRISRL